MPEEILQLLKEIVEKVSWGSVANAVEKSAIVQKHLDAAQAAPAEPAEPEVPATPEGSNP